MTLFLDETEYKIDTDGRIVKNFENGFPDDDFDDINERRPMMPPKNVPTINVRNQPTRPLMKNETIKRSPIQRIKLD